MANNEEMKEVETEVKEVIMEEAKPSFFKRNWKKIAAGVVALGGAAAIAVAALRPDSGEDEADPTDETEDNTLDSIGEATEDSVTEI